jgi:hypothetical protein
MAQYIIGYFYDPVQFFDSFGLALKIPKDIDTLLIVFYPVRHALFTPTRHFGRKFTAKIIDYFAKLVLGLGDNFSSTSGLMIYIIS